MLYYLLEQQRESEKISLYRSAELTREFYPESLFENPIFKQQIEQRTVLNQIISELFFNISNPKMNLSEAYQLGLVTEESLINLYSEFTKFLNADFNNSRIILYFPNSFLLNETRIFSPEFIDIYEKFVSFYKDAWLYVLNESEVRASFTNGDVLEPGMKDPERIRKAAHLLPYLIEKKIFTANEVLQIIFESEDEELITSLLEGFITAYYSGLISKQSIKELISMSNRRIVIKVALEKVKQRRSKSNPEIGILELHEMSQQIEIELQKFRAAQSSEIYSKARAEWLLKEYRIDLIQKYALQICDKLNFDINLEDEIQTEILISAIFIKAERESLISQTEYQFLKKIWDSTNLEMKTKIRSGLIRLYKLNVIDDISLGTFDIKDIDLAKVQHALDESTIAKFNKAIESIRSNPDLNRCIYPQVVLFGSKVKGYAALNSDVDIAIFFRPEVNLDEREYILHLLKQIPELQGIDKILEFYLDVDEQGYKFRKVEIQAPTIVGAPEIHILFNSTWLGDEQTKKIKNDIILEYLNLQRFKNAKEQVRSHLLRQLEMDTLQFRLMHKGFRMFYPDSRNYRFINSELIDWNSSFWDEGFRRIATQLFLNKVFLPNIQFDEQ